MVCLSLGLLCKSLVPSSRKERDRFLGFACSHYKSHPFLLQVPSDHTQHPKQKRCVLAYMTDSPGLQVWLVPGTQLILSGFCLCELNLLWVASFVGGPSLIWDPSHQPPWRKQYNLFPVIPGQILGLVLIGWAGGDLDSGGRVGPTRTAWRRSGSPA